MCHELHSYDSSGQPYSKRHFFTCKSCQNSNKYMCKINVKFVEKKLLKLLKNFFYYIQNGTIHHLTDFDFHRRFRFSQSNKREVKQASTISFEKICLSFPFYGMFRNIYKSQTMKIREKRHCH